MPVENFFSVGSVEAFHVPDLRGLSLLDELQLDAVPSTPLSQYDGDELRAVVHL